MTTKKFFFILLAILLLSSVGIVGSFFWGTQVLQEKADTISDLIAERDLGQDKIVELNKAKSQSDKIEYVTNLTDRLLPTEKKQETLIVDIIRTATAKAGIPLSNIANFSFSGTNEPDDLSGTVAVREIPGVYSYPFNLQIRNIPYETLLDLLKEIETNSRIVHVASIQISPDRQTRNLSTVNLSLKAYLKP